MTTIKELLHKSIIKQIKTNEKWLYLEKYGEAKELKIFEQGYGIEGLYLSWHVFKNEYCIKIAEDTQKEFHIEEIARKLGDRIIETTFSMNWRTLQVLFELFKNVNL